MAGEIWRSSFQIGKETTAGTSVAATRKVYYDLDNSRFTKTRAPRPKKLAAASRQPYRAMTLGPVEVGGTLQMPLSASEIIEWLLMTIQGGVTPADADPVFLWTFTPGTSLDAATIEWNDGSEEWEATGVYGNQLRISGSVRDETIVTLEPFAHNLSKASLTGSLDDRLPDFIEGWETALYIDALGGTPGTTAVTGTLINWDIAINNQLGRKYFAANTQTVGGITIGELLVTANLTFEAAASASDTAFTDWEAVTEKLIRLEFGQNEVIDGSDKKFVTVDIPGAWQSYELGQTDEGTRVYQLGLHYLYDVTNAFGLQIRCQNARDTAYSETN